MIDRGDYIGKMEHYFTATGRIYRVFVDLIYMNLLNFYVILFLARVKELKQKLLLYIWQQGKNSVIKISEHFFLR